MGLEAASSKLREVVEAVLQLPQEAQDEVADAWQSVLQELLPPPTSLDSLPRDVLAIIARLAGRPSRRAARLFSNAYGLLDCGLRLDGLSDAAELARAAGTSVHRFDHVTSLVLTIPEPPKEGAMEYPEAYLPALCTALPQLATLSAHPITGAELATLAPLLPRLTALTLRPSAAYVGAARPNTPALTALRSLALPLHAWGLQAAREELESLSCLCQLHALEWLDDGAAAVSAATHFTALLFVVHLTSLLVRPVLHDWDQAAVDTLLTGFPDLAALALNVQSPAAYTMELLAGGDTPVTALAERTALTSLHLTIGEWEQVEDLLCLSTLQRLSKLSVIATPGPGMEDILEALSTGIELTSLYLAGRSSAGNLAGQFAVQLPPLPGTNLQNLGLACMVLSRPRALLNLGHLALVTRLRLGDIALVSIEEPVGLAQLSNLQVLEICSEQSSTLTFGNSGVSQRHMLKELGGLSRLRDLTLTVCEHLTCLQGMQMGLKDVDLWRILPLQHTLTRLVLGGIQCPIACPLRPTIGHGLAVVGRLTCLRDLVLRNMEVLQSPCLHEYLLPLPASLRRLELEADGVVPGVQASLQAAARGQDCVVHVGRWV